MQGSGCCRRSLHRDHEETRRALVRAHAFRNVHGTTSFTAPNNRIHVSRLRFQGLGVPSSMDEGMSTGSRTPNTRLRSSGWGLRVRVQALALITGDVNKEEGGLRIVRTTINYQYNSLKIYIYIYIYHDLAIQGMSRDRSKRSARDPASSCSPLPYAMTASQH